MDPKLNFVIVGCGSIALRHANAIINYGNLLAVCDNNLQAAKKFAAKFNCAVYTSLNEMLNDNSINVVSICTPNWLHAQQSILCMQKGYHVLCEKPMAINVDDAFEMIQVSKTTAKELFIVKQLRHYPSLIFLKKLIIEGHFEKISSFQINCFWNRDENYYRDWRGIKKTDGGTLYTQFSHYIDLIIWLFGEVTNFNFTCANHVHPKIEFEDCGVINFNMKSGIIGSFNYSVNAYKQNIENSISILSENGAIKLSGSFLENFDYFNLPGIDMITYEKNTSKENSHFKVYKEVIACLQNRSNTATKAEDSIQSIELIEKIYNSLQH